MAALREIRIPVRVDAKTFRHFALFDTFVKKKSWIRPMVFAVILLAFSVVALLSGKPQSGMIAAVLLVIGIGLPVVYFGMFLSQVGTQAEKQKLGKGKAVYTVTLRMNDFFVVNNQRQGEALTVTWQEADRAYRSRHCIYLYANPQRAFLLPAGQANASDDEVWQTLVRQMSEKRCRRIL